MTSLKPVFPSLDPMDHFCDPLDTANENSDSCHPFIAEEIRAIRKRLNFSQRQFAGFFGFPLATLRHWEYGRRQPTGCAYVLLQVIRDNPRAVLQAVRKARRRNDGRIAKSKRPKSFRLSPGMRTPLTRVL
jgi:DNA-binding transcriptional regulator YiaG